MDNKLDELINSLTKEELEIVKIILQRETERREIGEIGKEKPTKAIDTRTI
jgi:hypothetical protein